MEKASNFVLDKNQFVVIRLKLKIASFSKYFIGKQKNGSEINRRHHEAGLPYFMKCLITHNFAV